MVLVKNCHFLSFYFRQYRPGKCVVRYSRTKRSAFYAIKAEELRFFLRGLSMVLGKNLPFFDLFLLGNIGQENVF